MAHPIDNSVSKVLEFIVLAITVGSSFWLMFFAMSVHEFGAVS